MPSPTNKAQDNSIRENVYRIIRENITSLQLAPGTTVSTQELAAKLQVSRTPVREAFIRLQKEDLVEITPQKGTMVSRIDLTRAEKERFIRESLETAILPLFLQNCTEPGPERAGAFDREAESLFCRAEAAGVHRAGQPVSSAVL